MTTRPPAESEEQVMSDFTTAITGAAIGAGRAAIRSDALGSRTCLSQTAFQFSAHSDPAGVELLDSLDLE
jgi:hypothetical protein